MSILSGEPTSILQIQCSIAASVNNYRSLNLSYIIVLKSGGMMETIVKIKCWSIKSKCFSCTSKTFV
jgi:hypothetical protein